MRYVYLIALLIFSSPAFAQMTGPFIEGASPYPSTVRCMTHKEFVDLMKARNFRIIMIAGGNEDSPIAKMIVTNDTDVMVTNVIPDNRVCVLDILDHTFFTNDFVFKENKPSVPETQD